MLRLLRPDREGGIEAGDSFWLFGREEATDCREEVEALLPSITEERFEAEESIMGGKSGVVVLLLFCCCCREEDVTDSEPRSEGGLDIFFCSCLFSKISAFDRHCALHLLKLFLTFTLYIQ